MICRGIIDAKLSKYKVKVRVPALYNGTTTIGAMPTSGINDAIIGTSAGVYPALRVGDVVLVGFEDDNIDKPVVLGILYNDNCYKILSDMSAESLIVSKNTNLSSETTIGKVKPENIKHLEKLNHNVEEHITKSDELLNYILNDFGDGQGPRGVHYNLLYALDSGLMGILRKYYSLNLNKNLERV